MKISIRHIGNSRTRPSTMIKITVEGQDGSIIAEDVTSLSGKVNQSFIDDLRSIADELEIQNNDVESQSNS